MSPEDDGLRALLGQLPRPEAPQIPVERLLRKLMWTRARAAALGLAAIAAPLLALLLSKGEPEPPVNLELRLVSFDEPFEIPERDPPELNLP